MEIHCNIPEDFPPIIEPAPGILFSFLAIRSVEQTIGAEALNGMNRLKISENYS